MRIKKHIILIVSFLVLLIQGVRAQDENAFSFGEKIDLMSGIYRSSYHPYMKIAVYDDRDSTFHLDLLVVFLVSEKSYYSYPEKSRLLIKFNDDEVFELESFGEVVNSYSCLGWDKFKNKYIDAYQSGRYYIISDELLAKLQDDVIVKLRIELSNGNYQDIEIEEKLGYKILYKLAKSYQDVINAQEERLQNLNDIHNGF